MKFPRLTKILFLYGNLVILCGFLTVFVTMILMSFNGYESLIVSNTYNEHWIEMFILISGLVSYVITYGKVKIKKKGVENNMKTNIMFVGIVSGLLIFGSVYGMLLYTQNPAVKEINNLVFDEPEPKWKLVSSWEQGLTPLGEATQADGIGFLSIFLLDYGGTPFDELADNGTIWDPDDGSYNASSTVHAYADADGFSEDCKSEDPFYICIRTRFTKAVAYNEAKSMFEGNRTKCEVTFTEPGQAEVTIVHYGNLTDGVTGGGVPSENVSHGDALFVNFWYDDNVDGYKLTDDGTLTISSIKIYAKY